MPRLICLALMIAATTLHAVQTVRADEGKPAVSEGARAAGEALLESGRAAYRFGNYVQAMRDYEQALARLGWPSIHYDIADAAARVGDHQKAIDEFREYLKALPNATNRESVERRIESQQQALQKRQDAPVTADLTPTAAANTQAGVGPSATAGATSTSDQAHGGNMWWLWAGIGAAVVATVVAALIVSSSDDPVQPPMQGDVGGTIQTLRVR